MLTLGIETSCDETSAAVVEDGTRVRSNVVSSQVALHAPFGGVVPELAARSHVERLPLVMDEALRVAEVGLEDIDLVAVTRGPGLVGALLVGVGFARALAWQRGLPIVGVSHLDGHMHSAFLQSPGIALPLLVLAVSGGHTELVLLGRDGRYTLLGRTLDDAAGEAFDKVARLLGLPYPGGPEIERCAARYGASSPLADFNLPPIRVSGLDFSFSGIKTAVRYRLERTMGVAQGSGLDPRASATLPPSLVLAAAAAFQRRAVEHLVDRLSLAAVQVAPASIAIVGGVAMNGALARAARDELAASGSAVPLVIPGAGLCTDNAGMIAAAGHALYRRGSGASLEVDPSLRWEAAS
ncbi:MAG: tRNA (adenosine(37)-N6)-threonylcarbamoyltransferase complex transferase subunit TsaD [Candidatus Dormibacteria bacterium]